jgi:hypothetical protein
MRHIASNEIYYSILQYYCYSIQLHSHVCVIKPEGISDSSVLLQTDERVLLRFLAFCIPARLQEGTPVVAFRDTLIPLFITHHLNTQKEIDIPIEEGTTIYYISDSTHLLCLLLLLLSVVIVVHIIGEQWIRIDSSLKRQKLGGEYEIPRHGILDEKSEQPNASSLTPSLAERSSHRPTNVTNLYDPTGSRSCQQAAAECETSLLPEVCNSSGGAREMVWVFLQAVMSGAETFGLASC